MPTLNPTFAPTETPTAMPTREPTHAPTFVPSQAPVTMPPTLNPTFAPTETPTEIPTWDPTFNPTAGPTYQSSSFAIIIGITLQGISATDVNNNVAVIVNKIAEALAVDSSRVALLSATRRRLNANNRLAALSDASLQNGETTLQEQSISMQVLGYLQRLVAKTGIPVLRRLQVSATIRFVVSGFASVSAADAAKLTVTDYTQSTGPFGGAAGLASQVNSACSTSITTVTVTEASALDTSLVNTINKYNFHCSLSVVDSLYWSVADDMSHVKLFMLHKGTTTTNLDWVSLGLVDQSETKMYNAARPIFVYLYTPNTPSTEYYYKIGGYDAGTIVASPNAGRSIVNQGVTSLMSIDNYVGMAFDYNVNTGVSTDIKLNLAQGSNNKVIWASGDPWPQMHPKNQYGFATVSWVDGVCAKTSKRKVLSNVWIWALLSPIALYNSKWSPMRHAFASFSIIFNPVRRLHPTAVSRFLGNTVSSLFFLDDRHAHTFSLPAIIIVLLYAVLNAVIFILNFRADGAALATGRVAVLNMWISLLPTAKSSILLRLTGVPFERAVKFHRITTMVGFSFCIAHLITSRARMLDVDSAANIFSMVRFGSTAVIPGFGTLAFIGFSLMVVTAIDYVRNIKYEVFLYVHYLWLISIAFNMLHFPAGSMHQLLFIPGLFFQLLDKFDTFITSAHEAVATKLLGAYVSDKLADVVALEVDVDTNTYASYIITFVKRIMAWFCSSSAESSAQADMLHGGLGQYYFVNVPSIKIFEWHPFSVSEIVASENNVLGSRIKFHIKSMGPETFTGKLADLTRSGPAKLKVHLRGPYGCLSLNITNYEHVLIIAGGIGITPMLPVLDRIRQVCIANKLEKLPKLKEVTVVWVARKENQNLFENFAERLTHGPAGRLMESVETGRNTVCIPAKYQNLSIVQKTSELESYSVSQRPAKLLPVMSAAKKSSSVNPSESVEVGTELIAKRSYPQATSTNEHTANISRVSDIQWNVQFYLTGQSRGSDDCGSDDSCGRFTSVVGSSFKCNLGRPDMVSIITRAKGSKDSQFSTCALMCGPTAMTTEAAKLCADQSIDYHLETFGW